MRCSSAVFELVSGGTDTHLLVIDLGSKELTGGVATHEGIDGSASRSHRFSRRYVLTPAVSGLRLALLQVDPGTIGTAKLCTGQLSTHSRVDRNQDLRAVLRRGG